MTKQRPPGNGPEPSGAVTVDDEVSCHSPSPPTSPDHVQTVHDKIVADIIVRTLSAPIVSDPDYIPEPADKVNKKKVPIPIWVAMELTLDEVLHVCKLAEDLFMKKPALLELSRPTTTLHVVADLHGLLPHLLRILRTCGSPGKSQYLFLGDYVDRGVQGMETYILLLCLKIRYPEDFFLLRGNHEDIYATLNYGFYDECLIKWNKFQDGEDRGNRAFRSFLRVFNSMPLAATIDGRIFCCHGGISPYMNKISDIKKVSRPAIIPAYGLPCDILWADPIKPEPKSKDPKQNAWVLSSRGLSFTFGHKQVNEFCQKNNIEVIIRGHQIDTEMYKTGYAFFCNRLVTIFSAPNYVNMRNNSCVVKIDRRLCISFVIYRVRQPLNRIEKDQEKQKEKEKEENSSHTKWRLFKEKHLKQEKSSGEKTTPPPEIKKGSKRLDTTGKPEKKFLRFSKRKKLIKDETTKSSDSEDDSQDVKSATRHKLTNSFRKKKVSSTQRDGSSTTPPPPPNSTPVSSIYSQITTNSTMTSTSTTSTASSTLTVPPVSKTPNNKPIISTPETSERKRKKNGDKKRLVRKKKLPPPVLSDDVYVKSDNDDDTVVDKFEDESSMVKIYKNMIEKERAKTGGTPVNPPSPPSQRELKEQPTAKDTEQITDQPTPRNERGEREKEPKKDSKEKDKEPKKDSKEKEKEEKTANKDKEKDKEKEKCDSKRKRTKSGHKSRK